MKKANVFVNGIYAGQLEEIQKGKEYRFTYLPNYSGGAVSLTMPLSQSIYIFHPIDGVETQAFRPGRKLRSLNIVFNSRSILNSFL